MPRWRAAASTRPGCANVQLRKQATSRAAGRAVRLRPHRHPSGAALPRRSRPGAEEGRARSKPRPRLASSTSTPIRNSCARLRSSAARLRDSGRSRAISSTRGSSASARKRSPRRRAKRQAHGRVLARRVPCVISDAFPKSAGDVRPDGCGPVPEPIRRARRVSLRVLPAEDAESGDRPSGGRRGGSSRFDRPSSPSPTAPAARRVSARMRRSRASRARRR